MNSSTIRRLSLALASCFALACGSTVADEAPAGPSNESMPPNGKADGAAAIDCDTLCAPRQANTQDGWCLPADECAAFCQANVEAWSSASAAAFQTCVESAPMCFRTAQQCVADETPVSDCAARCASRDDHDGEGWCLESDECTAACEMNEATWSPAESAAFDTCVADAPLCYRTLESCVSAEADDSSCAARCAGRDERAVDGWCLSTDECIATCETNESSWSDDESAAFDGCLADAPLCFRTVDSCVADGAAEAECATRCASRDAHADDGWCLDSSECVEFCQVNVQAWSAEESQSFDTCVADAPLCFRTVEDCVTNE